MADQQNETATGNSEAASAAASPPPGNVNRVKIFTVHDTFDNQASWDDWDHEAADKAKTAADANNRKDGKNRNFINRLRDHLASEGVTLDEMDHTQEICHVTERCPGAPNRGAG